MTLNESTSAKEKVDQYLITFREYARNLSKDDLYHAMMKLEEIEGQLAVVYFRNYGFRGDHE